MVGGMHPPRPAPLAHRRAGRRHRQSRGSALAAERWHGSRLASYEIERRQHEPDRLSLNRWTFHHPLQDSSRPRPPRHRGRAWRQDAEVGRTRRAAAWTTPAASAPCAGRLPHRFRRGGPCRALEDNRRAIDRRLGSDAHAGARRRRVDRAHKDLVGARQGSQAVAELAPYASGAG